MLKVVLMYQGSLDESSNNNLCLDIYLPPPQVPHLGLSKVGSATESRYLMLLFFVRIEENLVLFSYRYSSF